MAEENDTGVTSIRLTRTELVWPGKYTPDGTLNESPRVDLPFQVIERVNETRATREARKQPQELSLFDVWEGSEGETFDDGWRNKLIWGDNLLVMGSLLDKFAGKIDLIYIDPPFATGADFSFKTSIGDLEIGKEQSILEEKAYRDTWGRGLDSYLQMMYERFVLIRELLAESGNLFVHIDHRVNSAVRLMLDEIFGLNLVNEIVWHYNSGPRAANAFGKRHDTILRYGLDRSRAFMDTETQAARAPYSPDINIPASKAHYYHPLGKVKDDVWSIKIPGQNDRRERTGFATQKPEELLAQIVEVCSSPGDLVADFFCGSGTAAVVAEKTGRRWIACDLSRWAVHLSRKRLLSIEGGRPFEILNLGRYERQYWQGVAFGAEDGVTQQAVFEYVAFILRLYGAEPVSGMTHLYGKKGKAMVHIGSVEAPVTIDEIAAAVDECTALKQTDLHVLGWSGDGPIRVDG